MTRVSLSIASLVFLIAPVAGVAFAQETGTLFFKSVNVFDGSEGIGVTNVLIEGGTISAVSYTHLTLPTICSV